MINYNTGKSTKVHLYYCMKNCNGSPDILRADILNIVEHYKVSATIMLQVQYDVLVFVGNTVELSLDVKQQDIHHPRLN